MIFYSAAALNLTIRRLLQHLFFLVPRACGGLGYQASQCSSVSVTLYRAAVNLSPPPPKCLSVVAAERAVAARGSPAPDPHTEGPALRLRRSVTATMLSALLSLALLPLALAACPCPPAPATATVCGSNNKTYPSACDLDCSAPPGVAAAHPGPCHPEDAAPGRPISAALLSRHRARRSASEEKRKFDECQRERQCYRATCSECGGDRDCEDMCRLSCACGCLGLQTSGLDRSRWDQCYTERECGGKWSACWNRCSTRECKDRCWMDRDWCSCGCMEQAATTPRPTSPAGTSPDTASPDTTSPASPASTTMWAGRCSLKCEVTCP